MAQTDSNSEDALENLVNRVKQRRAKRRRDHVPAPQEVGLRPSDILSMSSEQKKIIIYLSRKRYARIVDIEQAIELDQVQTLKILSFLKDEGYVYETSRDGEIFYRVKFSNTINKNNLPQEP